MAMRADRVLQPLMAGLQNSAKLRDFSGRSELGFDNEPIFVGNPCQELSVVLDIDEMIEMLNEIASKKSSNSMGFNPKPINESDVRIGKIAEQLSKNLEDPDGLTIQTAIKFISTCGLIEKLKDIERKRSNSLSLFSQRSKNDIMLGNRAHELLLMLEKTPENPNRYVLEEALEFQDLAQVIEILEEIVSEKLEGGNLGFGNKDENPDEKTIGKRAADYLNALKEEQPDDLTKRKAKIFIESVYNIYSPDSRRRSYSSPEIFIPESQITIPGFF